MTKHPLTSRRVVSLFAFIEVIVARENVHRVVWSFGRPIIVNLFEDVSQM